MAEVKKISKKSDPCWEGYEQKGTKKKNGKTVPDCIRPQINYTKNRLRLLQNS